MSHHLNNTIKSDKALKLAGISNEVQELVELKRESRNSTEELKKISKNHLSVTIIKCASTHFTFISRAFIQDLQLSWACLNHFLARGVKCLTGPYFLMREPTEDKFNFLRSLTQIMSPM